MPVMKINEFDPNYHETIEGNDIKGMGLYAQGSDEKIGTVSDVLVDEQGEFRYLVVDLGFWIFGKKVLLPMGRARIDVKADRVYAVGMTRQQADDLPEFNERTALDFDHEEQVRGVYRQAPLEASAPLDAASSAAMTGAMAAVPSKTNYDRDTYKYDQDASLYDVHSHDDQTFKLYQERLIANKTRVKSGEVAIGKRVETETARVSVPIEKERVVIERVTPADAGRAVAPGTVNFGEGEVARVEIYEETPDIHKEAFVREEVKVTKVVDQETVEAQETIRREELDIDSQGSNVEERTGRLPNDRV